MPAENTNFFSSNPDADKVSLAPNDLLGPIGFAGREDIIDLFDRQASSWPHMHGIILHGRRQIGKSWLVRKYCETSGKPYIYFQATRDDIANEDSLAGVLSEFMYRTDIHFTDAHVDVYSNHLYDLIRRCLYLCKKTGATFVIDEFNFLIESKSFDLSVLQRLVDEVKEGSDFLFVLCGSNSGILQSLADYNNPLYGRFEDILEVAPISYKAVMQLMPSDWPTATRIMASILCSGMPQMVLSAQSAKTWYEFMTLLLQTGKLRGIARSLLQSERLDHEFVDHLTGLLSKAPYGYAELRSKLSMRYGLQFDQWYNKMLDVRLLQEIPCRYSRHLLKNRMVRLTNTILPLLADLNKDRQGVCSKFGSLNPAVHEFFGLPFEDFCAQFLISKLKLTAVTRAYWEDIVGTTKERREVDVVLQTPRGDVAYICECKFKDTQADADVIYRLLENIGFMSLNGVKAVPIVVSLGGFTSQALFMAEERGVLLYSGSDIEKWTSQ